MQHRQMVEAVAQRICSTNDPYRSCEQKPRRSICNGIKECKIAEKSEKQLGYVLSSNAVNIFLKACPGGGKTEVVGLKAAYEFKAWKHKNCGIAILTFTNNAADVIEERVRHFAGIEKTAYPHFIGTIDSWLHRYFAHPFGHLITEYKGRRDDIKNDKSVRLVDDSVSEGWIANYTCDTGYCYFRQDTTTPNSMPLYANMLQYDTERDCWEIRNPTSKSNEYRSDQNYFNSPAFKSFRSDKMWLTLQCVRKSFMDIKKKFLRDGFATYQDVEWICYRLLKEREGFTQRLSQRFPFIIVDECQDLSWIQLEILGFLKQAGTRLHFVGDLHQAIYKFKKVEPKKVEDFVLRHNLEHQELKENYRSCQQIVDLCQKLIDSNPVEGKGTSLKKLACVCFTYKDKNEIIDLPFLFEKYLHNEGFDINKSAVLARGRSMVYQLKAIDRENIHKPQVQLAMAIHLWKNKQPESMDDSLRYLGHFITAKYFKKNHSNSLYHYCPESVSSPMRWRLFLARVLDECLKNDCGIKDLDKSWNSWSECVRSYFSDIVVSCLSVLQNVLKSDLSTFDKLDGKTFRVLTGSKNLPVIHSLTREEEKPSRLRITTIHSVKGATFDAVLLVSSLDQRGGKGGHWTEWRIDPESEHARFAYVASSRPKRLLAWAIPSSDKNTDSIKILEDLGFSFADLPYDNNHICKGYEANG